MSNTFDKYNILQKRLAKLAKHIEALQGYKQLIDKISESKSIVDPVFETVY